MRADIEALVELMEEILVTLESRDTGDADGAATHVALRLERLEDELIGRLGASRARSRQIRTRIAATTPRRDVSMAIAGPAV